HTIASAAPFIESKIKRRSNLGDFVPNVQADRLNTRFTAGIFAISSVLLGTGHIWGEPITCWTPHQFPHKWDMFISQNR
ncbi:hypothetical protein PENTCL1PPCAC_25538, partial [Pristionchus entomophagus]